MEGASGSNMRTRDIIVVGASAGGVEALCKFVSRLPEGFPASIFVVVHFPEHGTSTLPQILSRAGRLPAVHAADGDTVAPGRIYVAPPNFHLLFERGAVSLVRGPKENGNRPAADPMFRSAAVAFGDRVIGVVLSGNLDDGTAGLAAIKRLGGVTVVQDPLDAVFPSMPRSALEHVEIDRTVPIAELAGALQELMAQPLTADPVNAKGVVGADAQENAYSSVDLSTIKHFEGHPGQVSPYGCPDCGGVLWEVHDGNFVRFRCRVGHAWTSDALLTAQSDQMDDALWTALRAPEESVALSDSLARRNRERGNTKLAERFAHTVEATEQRASTIRGVLLQRHGMLVHPVQTDAAPDGGPEG
jgi:two-component system chemotaxis response regulator CheB